MCHKHHDMDVCKMFLGKAVDDRRLFLKENRIFKLRMLWERPWAAQRIGHVRSVENDLLRLSTLTAFLFSGPPLSQPLTSQRTLITLHPDPRTSQKTRATLSARLRHTTMLRRYSMGFYQSRFGRKTAVTLYRATAFMTTAAVVHL